MQSATDGDDGDGVAEQIASDFFHAHTPSKRVSSADAIASQGPKKASTSKGQRQASGTC